jgi:hypothetical protein
VSAGKCKPRAGQREKRILVLIDPFENIAGKRYKIDGRKMRKCFSLP